MTRQVPVHFEFRANQTFDDFFPGTNLEIINHLQTSIAGNGERQVFLWGQSGLGKSHLLQACCQQAQSLQLSSFYFALSSLELPDPELLTGLDKFDVVCFDNIEHIAGNQAWELGFFNFFNLHRDQGHTLILSAACPPNEIAIQLPDLKTRLNWGLTLKIQPLCDTDRITALIFKAGQMGFEISPQAGRFLLTHYDRDLSSLWALLTKLDRASLAAKRKLTIPFLKQILNEESRDH
ncbi:MAG: DnaA regulatory inactivator Hda [Methylococcaceae bacterium]|nr:DnaA regulatory inactivator Hda [Methylococcaceae bacterium]MDD1638180.1 DnaA regulatory inactivator Hda [Methylococcaceae bacterium]MDD1641986.1 DnaA regulatory inactivator Hda [Methylococcaceae bacterium]